MKKNRAKMSTKVLSVLLIAALLVGMLSGVAYAAEAVTVSVPDTLASYTYKGLTVAAGETVSVDAASASYYHLIIESEDITVSFGGKDYSSANGVVDVFLNKNAISVQFNVTNNGSQSKNLDLKFVRHDGHKTNPIVLEAMTNFTVDQKAIYSNTGPDKEGTFYQWTAPADGVLELKVARISSETMVPMLVINETIEAENGSITLNVSKDQVLEIQIAALMYGVAFDAQIDIEAKFVSNEPEEPTEPTEPVHECYVDHFVDVDTSRWYHDALDYMVSKGYMNGMSDTTMEPNGNLTRAQWAKLLYEVEGAPSVAGMSHPFTDVPAGKWYTNAVIWAFNEGIVKGVSETTFGPGSNITREQMATMLYRYAGSPKAAGSLDTFRDGDTVGNFAKDAMLWATQNGIINGVGNDYLEPKGKATRAQAAKILYEYMQ